MHDLGQQSPAHVFPRPRHENLAVTSLIHGGLSGPAITVLSLNTFYLSMFHPSPPGDSKFLTRWLAYVLLGRCQDRFLSGICFLYCINCTTTYRLLIDGKG